MEDLEKTRRLSDSEFREWVTACLVYQQTGEIVESSPMVALCFDHVQPRIDKDVTSWENRCKANKENSKKGGRPPKPKETEENPMGFLETQQNPSKPKKPQSQSQYQYQSQDIQETKREEECSREKIEGSGGKEEPAPTEEKETAQARKPYTPPTDEEWAKLRDEGLAKLLQSIGGQT